MRGDFMYLKTILFIIFAFTSILNIISVKDSNTLGECLTKPLIIPILLLIYVFNTNNPNLFIVFALLAGFLGDVFLMKKDTYFISGLAFFLIGHIFYIIAFLTPIFLFNIPFKFYIFLFPYVLIGLIAYKKLSPCLKDMKIQTTLYAIVIMAMSFSSLIRIYAFNGYQFWLPFIGSILFVSSDAILAFNKFKNKINGSNLYIMATYISAQLLIILGFM